MVLLNTLWVWALSVYGYHFNDVIISLQVITSMVLSIITAVFTGFMAVVRATDILSYPIASVYNRNEYNVSMCVFLTHFHIT